MLADLQQLARRAAPQEICGILLGREGRVSARRAARNVADEPHRHFEIDPRVLIDAERRERSGGVPILGYYHSHPSGTVRPSRTDAGSAAPDGRPWLILNGEAAAAWQSVPDGEIYGRFSAIALDCSGPKGQTAAD